MTNEIRFLQNGIKVNGEYRPMLYWYNAETRVVTVHAKRYGDQIPREIGNVHNETDSMSDYFDTDSCELRPGDAYYLAAYAACKKQVIAENTRLIKHLEKKLQTKLCEASRWCAEFDIENCRRKIAAFV